MVRVAEKRREIELRIEREELQDDERMDEE
jgi:hypothetical protein